MTAALTDTEVARLRGLLDALDSALRLHDSTTDHHPDAVEIPRAMNTAGRGEEVEDRGEPDWVIGRAGDRWDRGEDGLYRIRPRGVGFRLAEVGLLAEHHWADTPTPAPDVTVEVRAPRWRKGEAAPDWLAPGAPVRVVQCEGSRHVGQVDTFTRIDADGYAELDLGCGYATVLELVDPAPEPAVDCVSALAHRVSELEDRVADYARQADLRCALRDMTSDRDRWRAAARNEVAPAPEPAVDWEARAKAAIAIHEAECNNPRLCSGKVFHFCRMAAALRGES